MEFISRWPNGCPALQAASRCRAWVFMVMVVNRTLSVSVTVRPGPVRVDDALLEFVEVQPALFDHPGRPVRGVRPLLRRRFTVHSWSSSKSSAPVAAATSST